MDKMWKSTLCMSYITDQPIVQLHVSQRILMKILIARDVTSGCCCCGVKDITVNGEMATVKVSGGALVPYIFILRTQANTSLSNKWPCLFPESVQGTSAELRRCEHYDRSYVHRLWKHQSQGQLCKFPQDT